MSSEKQLALSVDCYHLSCADTTRDGQMKPHFFTSQNPLYLVRFRQWKLSHLKLRFKSKVEKWKNWNPYIWRMHRNIKEIFPRRNYRSRWAFLFVWHFQKFASKSKFFRSSIEVLLITAKCQNGFAQLRSENFGVNRYTIEKIEKKSKNICHSSAF